MSSRSVARRLFPSLRADAPDAVDAIRSASRYLSDRRGVRDCRLSFRNVRASYDTIVSELDHQRVVLSVLLVFGARLCLIARRRSYENVVVVSRYRYETEPLSFCY